MGLLAFAATVIVWMILSNTLVSAQEQGRRRTGILQALGVTKAQLYRGQALQALRDWLIALVGSHGILALVVLAAGWVQRWDQGLAFRQLLLAVAREDLTAYPWLLHLGLCLLGFRCCCGSTCGPWTSRCRPLPLKISEADADERSLIMDAILKLDGVEKGVPPWHQSGMPGAATGEFGVHKGQILCHCGQVRQWKIHHAAYFGRPGPAHRGQGVPGG